MEVRPVDAGQGAAGIHSLVDGYLRHLTIERGLSKNTLAAYRRDLGRYEVWLAANGVSSFEAIGEQQIGAFTRQLATDAPDPSTGVAAPLAASSVARIVSSVRGLHRFLAEEGQAPVNAAREVKPPKLPSRLPKAISIEQMTALLEATGGDDPGPQILLGAREAESAACSSAST